MSHESLKMEEEGRRLHQRVAVLRRTFMAVSVFKGEEEGQGT